MSVSFSYIGIRVYIVLLKRVIMSSYDELTSATVISIRGIMTSFTEVSPKSKRLSIICRSSFSMIPSSWLTLTIVRSSSSVIVLELPLELAPKSFNTMPARWSTIKITGVSIIISPYITGEYNNTSLVLNFEARFLGVISPNIRTNRVRTPVAIPVA